MSETLIRNPFPVTDAFGKVTGWKWYDETWTACERVFPTQEAALKDLTSYVHFLNHGPTLWQRVWWPVRYSLWPLLMKFWHDQSTVLGRRR